MVVTGEPVPHAREILCPVQFPSMGVRGPGEEEEEEEGEG